ncbi:MAG TPA: SCO family protein [Candidatus Binatia bacterium]|jgi:protein SCO1/2
MSLKSTTSWSIFPALLALLVSWSAAWSHVPIPPKAPAAPGRRVVNIPVPDFSLKDQDGKTFHFTSIRGEVVLVTFIFTTCPDVCPLLTANFAAIQRDLDKQNIADYRLLSITTDPERDTPPVLKAYAGRFKAQTERWSFLTGSRRDLAKIWKAFGVSVVKNQSGQIQHTTFTTIVDRQGNRRVDYYGDKWRDADVLADIQRLRKTGS